MGRARKSRPILVETTQEKPGKIEWLLAPNRRFAAVLADKGYLHSYQERLSGYNWENWEQGLEPGLTYLSSQIE